MRIESSVTAISWISPAAIEDMPELPFELGLGDYDDSPPEQLENLDALRRRDSFRTANELRAWIDVDEGEIVDYGYSGRGVTGIAWLRLGRELAFSAVQYPLLQEDPERGPDWVRFTQTAGGLMGLPAPIPVSGRPYVQLESAVAWTTLELRISADGGVMHALVGASPFPRHWVYDGEGKRVEESGTINLEQWLSQEETPWGGKDSPALATAVASALERDLARVLLRGGERPERRSLEPGETLVSQGEEGRDLFLLVDGVLDVEVDGRTVAEVGPGAVLGERALVERGPRTATLRAATPARVAVLPAEDVDESALRELARAHRLEEKRTS
jgi:Cyclic nucleotide-binding domain